MREELERTVASGNQLILSHPVAAIAVTSILLLMTVGTLGSVVDSPATDFSWSTVVAVILIAYGGTMAIVFHRVVRRPANEVLVLTWSFGISSTLIAWASSVSFGTPTWVPGLGFVVTLVALIVTTRLALTHLWKVRGTGNWGMGTGGPG